MEALTAAPGGRRLVSSSCAQPFSRLVHSRACLIVPVGPCTSSQFPACDRWGSPEFIGLGFLSFIAIILTELFGSPFLKNISIIVGLAVGCIVAGAAGYIDGSSIKTAPAITFLW